MPKSETFASFGSASETDKTCNFFCYCRLALDTGRICTLFELHLISVHSPEFRYTAWTLARELTKKPILVNDDSGDIVNPKLTIVNWRESHFRAFLKHLYPCAWVKQTVRLSERFLVSSHPRARGCNPCGMTLVPQGVQSARIRPAIRLPRILCSASIF